MIFKLCKKVIASGNYTKNDMQNKLDVYLLCNRITQEQYEELVSMIEKDQSTENVGDETGAPTTLNDVLSENMNETSEV